MGKFFKTLWLSIKLKFGKKLPKGWEAKVEATINFLQHAKAVENSVVAFSIAALLKKVGGGLILAELQKITNEALVTLQIAKGAADATKDITDPELKADAIMKYILDNISKLDSKFDQGMHIEAIATKILVAQLNITNTAAKTLVNAKYGEMFKEAKE